MKIHIHKDGKNYGPYSIEQIEEFVAKGNFTNVDLACCDGKNWIKLSEVPGFETTAKASSASPTQSAVIGAKEQEEVESAESTLPKTKADSGEMVASEKEQTESEKPKSTESTSSKDKDKTIAEVPTEGDDKTSGKPQAKLSSFLKKTKDKLDETASGEKVQDLKKRTKEKVAQFKPGEIKKGLNKTAMNQPDLQKTILDLDGGKFLDPKTVKTKLTFTTYTLGGCPS
jgi:hypothetical protein